MKTWTEWIGVSEPNDNLSLPINKDQYEAILEDGIKHGMTLAAEIVHKQFCESADRGYARVETAKAILTARDGRTK